MKKLITFLVFVVVLAALAPTNMAFAKESVAPIKPNEGDILPGPFEEWRVEYSYLYYIEYGPWEEEGTEYCGAKPCRMGISVTRCSETGVDGQVKVSIAEIEFAVGFQIGVQECKTKYCDGTCNCGEALILYSRYKRPVYKIVQRKYIIDQLGREHPTDEYAYAYAYKEDKPECLAVCVPLG